MDKHTPEEWYSLIVVYNKCLKNYERLMEGFPEIKEHPGFHVAYHALKGCLSPSLNNQLEYSRAEMMVEMFQKWYNSVRMPVKQSNKATTSAT